MATVKSSSDLTCGEGMNVCTPRAGAFESMAVLGVWRSGLGGWRGLGFWFHVLLRCSGSLEGSRGRGSGGEVEEKNLRHGRLRNGKGDAGRGKEEGYRTRQPMRQNRSLGNPFRVVRQCFFPIVRSFSPKSNTAMALKAAFVVRARW